MPGRARRPSKRQATIAVALAAIVAVAAVCAANPYTHLALYQAIGAQCGSVAPGATDQARTERAYGCLLRAHRACQAAQMSSQVSGVMWSFVAGPRPDGCALRVWEMVVVVDRQQAGGLAACRELTREWFGLRARACGRYGDVLLAAGAPPDPPDAASCGTAHLALSADPPVDPGEAQAAENCFARAADACQPAVLHVDVVPSWAAGPDDTGARTVVLHRAFAIGHYRAACGVVLLDPSLSACALAHPTPPDGLHLACPHAQDLVVPSGTGQRAQPFAGRRCGAIAFTTAPPSASAGAIAAPGIADCFLRAWARCEGARLVAAWPDASAAIFTVAPGSSGCTLAYQITSFGLYQMAASQIGLTFLQGTANVCSAVAATADGASGLRFTGCGPGPDLYIIAHRAQMTCANATTEPGTISAQAADCFSRAFQSCTISTLAAERLGQRGALLHAEFSLSLNHLRCTVTIHEYDASATRLGSTGHDCAGIVRDTAELRFEQCYPGGDVALRVVSGL